MNIVEGKRAVSIAEVEHILVPGRGRSLDGAALSSKGLERAVYAARVWKELALTAKDGVAVACGYKSPGDFGGIDFVMPGDPMVYQGIPEADLLARAMQSRGVPAERLRIERHSIDTATNLVNAESGGYFPDNKPVAIISQEEHLDRIINRVAPKVLRREFVGIVVPEAANDRDHDGVFAGLATRAILLGITPETEGIAGIVYSRAETLWRFASRLPIGRNYNIDPQARTTS